MKKIYFIIVLIVLSKSMLGNVNTMENMFQQQLPFMDSLLIQVWDGAPITRQSTTTPPYVYHNLVFLQNEREKFWDGRDGDELLIVTTEKKKYLPRIQKLLEENKVPNKILIDCSDAIYFVNLLKQEDRYGTLKKYSHQNETRIVDESDTVIYVHWDFTTILAVRYKARDKWEFKTEKTGVRPPLKYNNQLIVSDIINLYCLNFEGKEIWRYPIGNIRSNYEIIGDMMYSYVNDTGIVAFDLSTKQKKWIYKLKEMPTKQIIIENDIIYFSNGPVYALNRHTGKLIWKTNEEKYYFLNDPISIHRNYIFAYCSDGITGDLCAIDKTTGEVKYKGWSGEKYRYGYDPYFPDKYDYRKMIIYFSNTPTDNGLIIGAGNQVVYGFQFIK